MLLVENFKIGRPAKFKEQNRVPFDLGDLQSHLVGIDQDLQQLLNNKPAVTYFGLCDKP